MTALRPLTGNVRVERTYVEMRDPRELRGALLEDARIRIVPAVPCPVSLSRRLYAEVGAAYHWRDRDGWSDERLAEYLAAPGVRVFTMNVADELAGFFELRTHEDHSVEIVLLGLLPAFHGRGLGKHLLTSAVQEAWRSGASRVWLHTCTLDAPAALPNYLARGFRVTRSEQYEVHVG